MAEHGLIQAADAAEVVVTGQRSKSRYVPLILPRSGDVAKTLAMFYIEEPPNGAGVWPSEYMMVLGDGSVRLDLVGVSSSGVVEVRVSYDAGRLALLMDKVDRMSGVYRTSHADNSVGECQDLVVGYKLYARNAAGQWVEHLHGPLTFQCNQATDMLDKASLKPKTPESSAPGGGGTGGKGHKFDHGRSGGPGGFDSSFLADETVTAGGESLLPTSGVVIIDVWDIDATSKYNPLVVPRGDDVDLQVATTRLRTSDNQHVEQPDQFMLMLDDNVAQIPLELHGIDVRWESPVKDIDELCEHLMSEAPEDERLGFKTHENWCRDILIPYKLFGRKGDDGRWVEYAHGPLLFKCTGDYALPDAVGKNSSPYRGPFMTWKSPSFMPQFMSSKDEEA